MIVPLSGHRCLYKWPEIRKMLGQAVLPPMPICFADQNALASPLLDLLNVRYVVTDWQIDHAETLVPSADIAMMSAEDRTNLV